MEPALRTRVGSRFSIAVAVAGLVAACVAAGPAERTPRERAVNFAVEGVVGAVDDGDTLTVVAANDVRFGVRLSESMRRSSSIAGAPIAAARAAVLADRPRQSQGRAAREALATLALGKPARAECYEIDRFGRPVCHVFVGAVNVNLARSRKAGECSKTGPIGCAIRQAMRRRSRHAPAAPAYGRRRCRFTRRPGGSNAGDGASALRPNPEFSDPGYCVGGRGRSVRSQSSSRTFSYSSGSLGSIPTPTG